MLDHAIYDAKIAERVIRTKSFHVKVRRRVLILIDVLTYIGANLKSISSIVLNILFVLLSHNLKLLNST